MGAREGGLRVEDAPEGRSAARVHLGTTGEIARASARASLVSLTPPTGMPALPDPPQHTQRRDLSLTSTCRRSWGARPARDVGCQCTSISRLCSPRHAGGCHERYEGTTSAGNHGWGLSCASRAARATRCDCSGRRALTYLGTSLGVPSTAGSQQRRPNARCAAVGEASEAS